MPTTRPYSRKISNERIDDRLTIGRNATSHDIWYASICRVSLSLQTTVQFGTI
jgi:hypothetical protein